MEKSIKLSVIVPIYNSEKYLKKCINSIINQTYNKIEIILIDDGSTDQSGKICDDYGDKYSEIQVCHKENGGLVSARKQGIEMAQGDYVTFVDSDDWLDTDCYKKLLSCIRSKDIDIVSSGLIYEWTERRDFLYDSVEEGYYINDQIKKDILIRMMYDSRSEKQGIIASVCSKIFKRKILKKVMENIDDVLTYGEDGAVVYSFMLYAKCMAVVHYSGYHYVQHAESMIHSYTSDSFEKIFRLQKNLEQILLVDNKNLEIREQIIKYISPFIELAVKSVYKIEGIGITYLFPYEKVQLGSRIVLYGAGDVGKSYWNCLKNGNYASVVAWVDKQYKNITSPKMEVEAPESIVGRIFDYVVIAIKNEKIAINIKIWLINQNIEEERIVWVYPVHIDG